MAFPQVQDGDTQSGNEGVNTTSHTLTYPTNLASGDLIISFLSQDGSDSHTYPEGWVQRSSADTTGTDHRLRVFVKTSDGTETGNFTVTTTTSQISVWRVFRITGWNDTALIEGGTLNKGDSSSPDPGSRDSGFSGEDMLWIAFGVMQGSATDPDWTVAPTNYTDLSSDVVGGGGGVSMGIARRELNAQVEDPGVFTTNESLDWAARVLNVRPASDDNAETSLDTIRTYQIRELVKP